MIYAKSLGPLRKEVEKILSRAAPPEPQTVSPY
jgi:hypothetical protein